MGVDFIGYNYVRIEPIPPRFRSISKPPISHKKQKELENMILSSSPEERSLFLAVSGIGLGPSGLIIPDEVEIPYELQEEFYETIGKEEDYLFVCWHTNTVYRKTSETHTGLTGRSYSGYADFCRELDRLNGRPMPYMPPDTNTAPENGLSSAANCVLCLRGLNQVRAHFVSDEWKPDAEKFGKSTTHRFDKSLVDSKDDIHGDSWFFREFYTVISLGAQSGVIGIS